MNVGRAKGHVKLAKIPDEEILRVAVKLASVNRALRAATTDRPGLFGDLAWELLNEVYAADLLGTSVMSDLLALKDSLPEGLLTRYVRVLERNGLLFASQPESRRDTFCLSLTDSGRELVRVVVESML